MIRILQPWHENLRKRQVKSPKVHLRDSGLLHGLLHLDDLDSLHGHPKVASRSRTWDWIDSSSSIPGRSDIRSTSGSMSYR